MGGAWRFRNVDFRTGQHIRSQQTTGIGECTVRNAKCTSPTRLNGLRQQGSFLPLSRFPLRGNAGAGGCPPRRWHAVCQQKALARILPRLPPQEGFQSATLNPPLRDPPRLAAAACCRSQSTLARGNSVWGKGIKDGRHVGLDFYDLLIETVLCEARPRTPRGWSACDL